MTLHPESPEVVDFVAAYEENRNLAHGRGLSGYRVVVVARRKYLAVDEVPTFEGRDCPHQQSGRFLVDRETRQVFTIRGYGQRGWYVGDLATLATQYRTASGTFRPGARCHVERGRGRVASW